jgi:hypothetical protein
MKGDTSMRIIAEERKNESLYFQDLAVGETFMFRHGGRKGHLCLKIVPTVDYSYIDLETNELSNPSTVAEVILCPAQVVLLSEN